MPYRHHLPLLLSVSAAGLSVSAFAALPACAASPTAIFSLSPASGQEAIPNTFPVDLRIDTGGQGVSATEVYLTIPAGLQYSSFDASTSVFDTNVTSPAVSGNTLHFDRAVLTAGGYTGAGEVIRLIFTPIAAGPNPLNIDQANSKAIAYSDSSNVLASVVNAQYNVVAAPVATPTPTPSIVSATPAPAVKKPVSLPVTGTSPLALLLPILPAAGYIAYRFRIAKER